MSVEALVGGLLRATYLVPAALAFALATRHGRYLPFWLPQCGTIAAYLAYYLGETLHWDSSAAVCGALFVSTSLGIFCHRVLFAGHVSRFEPYPALLRGIALGLVIENLAGIASGGYALAYATLRPSWQRVYGWPINDTLRLPDMLSIASVVVLSPALWFAVNHTRRGLAYRCVSSNRKLAQRSGMPIDKVDLVVVLGVSLLSAGAGIVYAMRYGLAPQMMTSPALKVVAVIVAFGPKRLLVVSIAIVLMGGVERLCQGVEGLSGFEHGISYALLIVGALVKYVFWPMWNSRHAKAAQEATS